METELLPSGSWMDLYEQPEIKTQLLPPAENDNQELLEVVTEDFIIVYVRTKSLQSSFLYVLSFNGLPLKKQLLRSIYTLDFPAPTNLQRYLLPVVLSDPPVNVFVQAEYDAGKRTAFLLTILNTIDPLEQYPQAICLSSKYELVLQNAELAGNMAKYYPHVKFWIAVEGVTAPEGCQLSEQVVFGTPEYVLKLATQSGSLFDLNRIKILVLQDADVMYNIPAYREQCYCINETVNPHCQKMYFASMHNSNLIKMVPTLMTYPLILKSKRNFCEYLDNITQFYILCSNHEDKYKAIVTSCATFQCKPILIFCSSPQTAKTLAVKMIIDRFDVIVCSCDLRPQQRIAVYNQFQNGDCKILIATDILTRDIHLNEFGIVCNYDLPSHCPISVYVNRVTRTGNTYQNGTVLNLIDTEESLRYCQNVEKTFNKKVTRIDTSDICNVYGAKKSINMSNS